jgi:DNA-binding NarL/FixJ family response regulator
MIRVMIADDHALVRDGLRRILDQDAGLQVVGEATDGKTLLEKLANTPADVVVLDLNMPEMGGIEALRRLRKDHARTAVLVVSMFAEDVSAARLLRSGAAGYLTKGRSANELVDAVKKVASGGRYITPDVAEYLLEATDAPPHEGLTEREHQVFLLIAAGKSPSDVANELGVSASTVSTYIARIRKQLGVTTLGEIVRYAARNGLS